MKSISFSDEMVRAILDGRKSMTRRILKTAPHKNCPWCKGEFYEWVDAPDNLSGSDYRLPCRCITSRCPYKVGDLLYVKEKPDIKLEITDIRVERVNGISDEDCYKEGVESSASDGMCQRIVPVKEVFQRLWDSIHGEGAWNLNPFCWVLEFRRADEYEEKIMAKKIVEIEQISENQFGDIGNYEYELNLIVQKIKEIIEVVNRLIIREVKKGGRK